MNRASAGLRRSFSVAVLCAGWWGPGGVAAQAPAPVYRAGWGDVGSVAVASVLALIGKIAPIEGLARQIIEVCKGAT